MVQNGVALSGTVHWMFDRGLLAVVDNSEILLSNHINDVDGVRKICARIAGRNFRRTNGTGPILPSCAGTAKIASRARR